MKRFIQNSLLNDFVGAAFCLIMGVALVLMCTGCSEDGKSVAGGGSEETRGLAVIEDITVGGVARQFTYEEGSSIEEGLKSSVGPGSVIRMSELDSITFDTTGTTYITRCDDSTGVFHFDSVTLKSPYVMLELHPYQDGDYWEWDSTWSLGDYSEDEVELTAYSVVVDLRKVKHVDINVFTFLETLRWKKLIKQGVGFKKAKQQAEKDLMESLGIYDAVFHFDDGSFAKKQMLATFVGYMTAFLQEPNEVGEAFANHGSLAAVDSVKWFFIREIRLYENIYIGKQDSVRVLMNGFLASLYGLGQCKAEREGFTTRLPYSDDIDIRFDCLAGLWNVSDVYKMLDMLDVDFAVMTDSRDGKSYKTVTYNMGGETQTWMAENLRYNSTDGLYSLSEVVDFPVVYINKEECTELYQDNEYCSTLSMHDGIEYNQLQRSIDSAETVTGTFRGICPEGWRLPSGFDWKKILDYMDQVLTEQDTNWLWRGHYFAQIGFEDGSAVDEAKHYAVKMDDEFSDYPREWGYEEGHNWAVALYVGAFDWRFLSNMLPDKKLLVRCIKDE